MTFGTLPIVLVVIFGVLTVAIIGECLYVAWRHRSFRHRSSTAPRIRDGDENFFNTNVATKELLYFFCLKSTAQVQLDPHDPSVKNTDGSSLDDHDQVVDVFKWKEATGPFRILSTIKEEDKEEAESTPDVDFSIKQVDDGDDGHTKTVFSTPCESPMFFMPVGSPSRDLILKESSVFVVSLHETGNNDEV